jgi:hypothetical protein
MNTKFVVITEHKRTQKKKEKKKQNELFK